MPERILVVEDEPDFAALMTLWMTEAGYEAVTAGTGNDALRQFYDHRPDLVVLDLALPGLDGWQVIERIREFSRVPILIVTARSAEADKVRGLKLGADDYITKPLELSGAAGPRRGRPPAGRHAVARAATAGASWRARRGP